MKYASIFVLAALSCAFPHFVSAQERGNVIYQSGNAAGVVSAGALLKAPDELVQGAPYSATITSETVQTLSDGNRIVHTDSGNTARDSVGRMRQDMPLPNIGALSAANAPHIVFIRDPVQQVSYTLNLTDKTAQKMPAPPAGGNVAISARPGFGAGGQVVAVNPGGADLGPVAIGGPLPPPPPPGGEQVFISREISKGKGDPGQVKTEDLGSQTMEGVFVTGVRTTQTIPASQIGNDKPIDIVNEVWTSPDLKTVVYSKRSDPRMGEQTFRLTNVARTEPDPSLFTVPADFKIIDGPKPIIYRANP